MMHRRPGLVRVTLALMVLVFVGGCTSSAPTTGQNGSVSRTGQGAATLALINGTLIDGTGAAAIPGAVVLMAGNRIIAAGPSAQVTVPPGVETIDVGGATILPGFINAHVHFAFDAAHLKAWAQGGVTTVRDEGAAPSQIADLKTFRASIERDANNARLVSFGSMMAVPGGYGQLYVSSPEEARQAVLTEVADGVDGIKVAIEDGYGGTRGLPKLTPEELKTIVDTAHAHHISVSGHITSGLYLQGLLDAGVDDVAHLPYDYLPSASVQQMIDDGVYLIPTFTVFHNYGVATAIPESNLTQIVQLGGKVALGNDYGGGPGDFELGIPMFEIESMAEAGMTPMQIIQASTMNAARVIGMANDLGTLQSDKYADVLVVGGDPLQDLQALRNVKLVVHNGVVITDKIRK